MVRAILFDCDGILLDSMKPWHNLEAHLASQANISLDSKQMDMLNKNTLRQTVEYFYKEYHLENRFETLYNHAYAYLLKQYQNNVSARKGILPVLKKLKSMNFQLYIASSSPAIFIQTGLQKNNLLSYFEGCFSAEDLNKSKQDTDFFRFISSSLQIPPNSLCLIDDSAYALAVARIVGIRTIGVHDTNIASTFEMLKSCADYAIDDFNQLNYSWFEN